jgi:putative membrane protein
MDTNAHRDPRVYLAVERTFLAWVRTGLALMGFGFVVARFGLFMREVRVLGAIPSLPEYGISTQFGVGLVLIGVVVQLVSVFRYKRLLDRTGRGEALTGPSWFAAGVAIALAIIGAVVAVRLMTVG